MRFGVVCHLAVRAWHRPAGSVVMLHSPPRGTRTVTVPWSAVQTVGMPRAANSPSTDAKGCWRPLALMITARGRTTSSSSALVALLEPWCPALRTSARSSAGVVIIHQPSSDCSASPGKSIANVPRASRTPTEQLLTASPPAAPGSVPALLGPCPPGGVNRGRAPPALESGMRMASPPIRASLTSSTRMSRTVESGGSSRRAAHNRTASIAWRKVAYSVLPPQFTAHYARALGAARRGADLRFSSPPPVSRSRYRALRQRTGQHAAPGAGAQRLPRRARGALVALVSREGGGRRRGAQTVARLVGAGVRLHHDPPRRRRRDAGDPALERRLRAAGDHGHERVRHRRRGDRKPRVRLVGGHVARADGGGEVPLPRRQYQRHDRHGAARLGGAVDADLARRPEDRGDRARAQSDADEHDTAQRAGARVRRRGGGGAARAATGAGRGRLRDRGGA